jgi:hypothetical protein
MANRFTDSRKWDDPWFRKLPCKYKAFFVFLLDKCNHAGIWKVDFESAEFHIGEKLSSEEILGFMGNRIVELKEKWFIPKFIDFQYQSSLQDLNPMNRVHKSVLDILKKEGAYMPLKRGVQGCKDKDKDKDKDNNNVQFLEQLKKTYPYADIETEFKKMDMWLSAHPGRKKTHRFIINWLNKVEKPVDIKFKPRVKDTRPDWMKEAMEKGAK